MLMSIRRTTPVLLLTLASCGTKTANQAEISKPEVIYGDDDRRDLFEADASPIGRELARSTVALVKKADLASAPNGGMKLPTETFGTAYGLCDDEPYRDQPNPAFCSGFLVAPDLIATAGHCVTSQADCDGLAFVFDFAYDSRGADPTAVNASNVFSCQSIVATQAPGDGADFAVVKLDRAVTGRTPVKIRRDGKIADGAPVVVVGHPAGLPTKIAGGAKVRANANDGFFVANLDTYGGNSGSAVFNATTKEVEGILVRGEQDFTTRGSCTVSKRCAADECRGEDVTRATAFAQHVPGGGTTDPEPEPSDEIVKTHAAEGLALAIPDNRSTGAAQTLNVTQDGAITAVKVEIKIKHPYVGDLEVYLDHPDGSYVALHRRSGGSADDLAQTYADAADGGATVLTALGTLKGKAAGGVWKVFVRDRAARDVGTLRSVKLTLKSQLPAR